MANSVSIPVKDSKQHLVEYLGLIQGNIARMAGNSAIMKGFAATFMAAMLGMSVTESVNWYYMLLAVIPLLAFVRMDVFYLQLEKRYRNLYALVAEKKIEEHHFALDLNATVFEPHKKEINKDSGFLKILCSVSVWQFYILFVAIAVALIVFIA